MVAPSGATSLVPALRRIAEIAALPADWDGYGAVPPAPRAIVESCVLIEAVAEAGDERRAPWTSAPIADGGLQLEWLGNAVRIEVQVGPDGILGYLVEQHGADVEEADAAAFDVVVAMVNRLVTP